MGFTVDVLLKFTVFWLNFFNFGTVAPTRVKRDFRYPILRLVSLTGVVAISRLDI